MEQQVFYRTVKVDGLSIFYREAGPKDAPTILLLHGLPSSSRMFQPLLTRLADSYHLVAPDYPGFGHSDWPDPKQFDYTFDHIASVMDHFTRSLVCRTTRFICKTMVGRLDFAWHWRIPERVQALIVQDAVAHNEGLGVNWATRRAFWADRPAHEEALRKNLLSLATTKTRHIGDDPNIELYDPDLWTDEYAFLNAPGQAQIQSDLFYDYRTNVDAYPKWQAWLKRRNRSFWCSGASTISRSISASRNAIARMYRRLKSTYSTQDTSRLTQKQMRSPRSYMVSWPTRFYGITARQHYLG